MTYSADFRNKVVQLYNSGTSTADLCAQFHISRSILYQWSEEAKVSNISKRDLATLQRHVATLENENSIYQKSLAALDLSIDNKVQIIDALKSEYSFYTLCRLLNLSKSTYINRQKSALIEKQLDVEDTLLKEKITIIFQKSDYRFGAYPVYNEGDKTTLMMNLPGETFVIPSEAVNVDGAKDFLTFVLSE